MSGGFFGIITYMEIR